MIQIVYKYDKIAQKYNENMIKIAQKYDTNIIKI